MPTDGMRRREKKGGDPVEPSEFAVKVPGVGDRRPLAISMNPLIQFNEAPDSIDRVRFDPSGAEVDEVGIGRVHRRGRAGLGSWWCRCRSWLRRC